MSEALRDKNLNLLEKRFPGILKMIEEKKEELLTIESVTVAEETAFTG